MLFQIRISCEILTVGNEWKRDGDGEKEICSNLSRCVRTPGQTVSIARILSRGGRKGTFKRIPTREGTRRGIVSRKPASRREGTLPTPIVLLSTLRVGSHPCRRARVCTRVGEARAPAFHRIPFLFETKRIRGVVQTTIDFLKIKMGGEDWKKISKYRQDLIRLKLYIYLN